MNYMTRANKLDALRQHESTSDFVNELDRYDEESCDQRTPRDRCRHV
jgi:hypothetical protein